MNWWQKGGVQERVAIRGEGSLGGWSPTKALNLTSLSSTKSHTSSALPSAANICCVRKEVKRKHQFPFSLCSLCVSFSKQWTPISTFRIPFKPIGGECTFTSQNTVTEHTRNCPTTKLQIPLCGEDFIYHSQAKANEAIIIFSVQSPHVEKDPHCSVVQCIWKYMQQFSLN